MKLDREKWIGGLIILFFLLLITFPFIVASNASTEDRVFGGLLINPVDGNSYLAKMRQGYAGNWLFTLPYTAEPGWPAAMNIYYLLLGHMARWLDLPLIFTFHAARVIGAFALAIALFAFFRRVLDHPWQRLLALVIALVGSGLGWLAASFGYFTGDFWVSEAFPFLASFVNPHFPLGMALQMSLLIPLQAGERFDLRKQVLILVASAILSVVYPFGLVVALTVLGIWAIWTIWHHLNWPRELRRVVCVGVGGLPYILYSFVVVNNHPVLTIWNEQNVNSSPNLLNLIVSFSPPIIFAGWAILLALRTKDDDLKFLMLWLLSGVIILYIPVNIQRRLSTALYIPVVTLAVFAISQLKLRAQRRSVLAIALLFFAFPTTALILFGAISAARAQNLDLFLHRDEVAAFDWLGANTPPNSLIMASPKTGNLIPVYSEGRVLYGHPFETANADEREALVTLFYSGEFSLPRARETLSAEDVDYIFYGPREHEIGPLPELTGWQIVYEQGDVQIWAPGE